jgi:hypothetical protein
MRDLSASPKIEVAERTASRPLTRRDAIRAIAAIAASPLLADTRHAAGQAGSREPEPSVPCIESETWLTRAGRQPIYNSRIFTRGFAYTVEWVGDPATLAPHRARFDALVEDLRQAFGNALTQWISSLVAIKNRLDEPLRRYVDSTAFYRDGSCKYNAPPSDRVRCRRNASYVVLVYGPGGEPFPERTPGGRGPVAMAPVEGRTPSMSTTRCCLPSSEPSAA